MPLSPAETAALREIERGLTAENAGRRGFGRRWGISVPLLAVWLILICALTVTWVVWDNPAALVLASTLLLLLPAVVVARLRYGHRVRR